MDFTGVNSSTAGWEVPELPELRLPPPAISSHLYPSAPRSLYKPTVVSEAYRLNGIPYLHTLAFPLPRDHCAQPVVPRDWRRDVPCQYYFRPSGWCPYGHSCRYSHSMKVYFADRARRGLGRKRKRHEM